MSKTPTSGSPPAVLRLAASAALMVSAFLLRQLLQRFGIELPPFLTLFLALGLAALFGGLLAGLLATVVGAALVDYFVFPPVGELRPTRLSDAIALAVFVATGILLSAIFDQYRRGQRRLAEFEGRQRLQETEEQLRQTSEYRKLALEAAGLGAWEFNLVTREVLWDEHSSQAFGCESLQHVSFDEVLEKIHPQDRGDFRLWLDRAIAGQNDGAFRREFRVVWPDQSLHWIASNGRVEFAGRGDRRRAVRMAGVNADITERKQVEERLRRSEARYRDLVEAIPAMLWSADAQGLRTNQNRRWCEYTGQTHEQVLGRGWRDVIYPEDLPRVLDCWHRAARTGEDYSLEYRIRRADGAYRWHRVHARLQRDADGHPLGWFGTSIDIDDQKRAEMRLRRFYDSSLFAILYWKIDGGVIDVNDRFLEMTGYSREDVVAGRVNWANITPPEYRAMDEDARRQIRETGVHLPFEKQFVRKDGVRVWGQFWAAAYEDDRTKGVSVILDVTARRQAEEKLRESEQQFRTLADAIPQLCWVAHADGWIFWYNRRWYEFTGTTPKQMEGWGWQSVHDPAQLPKVMEQWKDSIATGTPFDMVFPIRGASGAFRTFLTRVMPVFNSEGQVVRWFGTNTDISEQKRIEAELRKSREQLDLALGVANLGEWDRDLRGNYSSRSLRHAQIFGYTSADDEWNFDTFLGHVLPQYRAEVVEQIEASQNIGTTSFETQIRRVDGTVRWLWIRSKTLPDEFGRPARVSGVVMDITERKQVEESLRQQAELLDLAHDTIMMCDLDGSIRFWNHGAVEMYGFSKEEATGQNAHTLLSTVFPQPMAEVKAHVLRNGRWEGELGQTTREGRGIVVASRWVLRMDGDGHPRGVMEINTDITERTRADEAQRVAHQRLQSVLDSITDGMMTLDYAWRFTYLNEQGAHLLGARPENLVGRCFWDMFPAADKSNFGKSFRKAVTTHLPVHLEEFYPEPLNIWLEFHCYPASDGLSVYFRDIGERKKAEEALLRSEKLASVGRMAATIAHEINNPLAAVTNLLFLAQHMEGMPDSGRQYIEAADAELKRVAHIVRQSLGFYRESNAPAIVSINAVLDSAVDLMKSKIREKHAIIERDCDDEIQVTALGGELRQVFSNLLSNSLDAIEENGKIRLRISAHRDGKSAPATVRVTVADDGQGIGAASLRHIFEPFFTTKGTVGTGLGLWVSKQIVDKHRGFIRLRSCTSLPHRGTVCSVVLPLDGPRKS